jgi:hypothetical protein
MALDARLTSSGNRGLRFSDNQETLRRYKNAERATPKTTTKNNNNKDKPSTKSKASTPKKEVTPKGKVIKIADSNLFIDSAQPSVEDMTNAIFQEIGGHELIGIVANDKVNPIFDLNGESSSYQPIQNLSSISVEYSPQNIMNMQDTDFEYFKTFPISLERFMPEYGTGADGSFIYTDGSGNLVIEFVNLRDDQRVQIETLSYGNVISDTIY